MNTKRFFVVAILILMVTTGVVSASNWTDGGSGHLWSTAGNWSSGVPTSGGDVYIGNGGNGPVIDSTVAAEGAVIRIGDTGTVENLTVTGGTLNSGHLILGEGTGSSVTMDMSGGNLVLCPG